MPPKAYDALRFCFYDIDDHLEKNLRWEEGVSHFKGNQGARYVHAGLLTLGDMEKVMATAESVHVDSSPLVKGTDDDYMGDTVAVSHHQVSKSTILHNMESRWIPLRRKCESLQEGFGCSCSVSAVATPPSMQTLKAHSNKHDAFVLQLKGRKQWSFYDTNERQFLPRNDQAVHRYNFLTDPNLLTDRPTSSVAMSPGDVMYIPRGVIHSADTMNSDETSLHVSFYLECAADRSIWEEVLHHIIASKSAAEEERSVVDHLPTPLPGYRVKHAGVFHMYLRILSDAVPALRRSVVGCVVSPIWVKEVLKDVIKMFRDRSFLQGVVDADEVRGVRTQDPRLIAWVMSGVEKPHLEQGGDGTVESDSADNQHIMSALKEYIIDVSGKGNRNIDDSSDAFFLRFANLFSDDATNSAAVDRVAAFRKAALLCRSIASNTHSTRHADLRQEPGIW